MLVQEVGFPDSVVPLVEELVAEARSIGGADCVYKVDTPEIRAAVIGATDDRIAVGVFMRITPTPKGATVTLRKTGAEGAPRTLTTESIAAIKANLPEWYAVAKTTMRKQEGSVRNPKWTRDELILALDLYFKTPPWTISGKHPAVLALSEELGRLAAYTDAPDKLRYRNSNGAYMKLMNLQYHDPARDGRGLKGGGVLEKEIWGEFGNDQAKLAKVAAAIRASAISAELVEADRWIADEDPSAEEAVEGRLLTRVHKLRERSSDLPGLKKRAVLRATGKLDCEGCGFNFRARYGEHAGDYAEVHHLTPLSELGENVKTTLADLAVVCANCHRMIHRRRQWLTMEELRGLVLSIPA